jgi:hypothetical protein
MHRRQGLAGTACKSLDWIFPDDLDLRFRQLGDFIGMPSFVLGGPPDLVA